MSHELSLFVGEGEEPIKLYIPCRRDAPGHRSLSDSSVALSCDHGGLETIEEEFEKIGFSCIPHLGGECPWTNLFRDEVSEIRRLNYEKTYRRRRSIDEELRVLFLDLIEKALSLGVIKKEVA